MTFTQFLAAHPLAPHKARRVGHAHEHLCAGCGEVLRCVGLDCLGAACWLCSGCSEGACP